ncbi:MAG TPA: hypothetical protein VLK23_17405 [Thermodesulfobacteriota bacterium]|nr:hypothetical protein [Thermodesulfobacteriota bacterium]
MAGQNVSGITSIHGWAFHPLGISKVELFVDDQFVGTIPYGSSRVEILNAFPSYPMAENSAFSTIWDYSILPSGNHTTRVRLHAGGITKDLDVLVTVQEEVYNFELMWGSYGTGDGQFKNPIGIAVSASGNIYVTDAGNSSVQKFDSSGNFISRWSSPASGLAYYPRGPALDLSENVYVLATEGTIEKFDSDGNFITRWHLPPNFLCFDSIAVDSPGNVYASTYYCCFLSACPVPDRTSIWKFDPNGNLIAKWGDWGTGDGQFDRPGGIALDPSGNIYVVDRGNLRIQKLDPNGNFISKWGLPFDYNFPNGLAADPWGNVYVLLSQLSPPFITFPPENPRVEKFDSNGNLITALGSHGNEEGQFSYPNGLAVDSSGNIYVADTYNQRIQKFSLTLPPITLESPSINEYFNACSLYPPPTFSWNVSATFKDYKVQFSSDRSFASVSFEFAVQSPATQITIPSDTWEEIMMIQGASGGTVYWRVIGTRADWTTETSAVRSFVVGPEPAGNPNISPTRKRSRPTLTWQTNCNKKFKVVFGSDSSLTKKTYSFVIENPNGSEGAFSKTLTALQWLRIKMLTKNKSGSTIYWYVESWDGLGRYSRTDVMSFVLTD